MALPEATFHILVALADTEKHGYAILQEVAERTGGAVKLNIGTLYTTIKRLLEQGWIEELDERPEAGDDERRRYYRITTAGRREVLTEAGRLERMLTMARRAGLAPRKAQ
jgi:DNA-binding PadR family transcriptional regulator